MSAMKLTPHLTRYTAVILLAATLLISAALALGHSGLLPYAGEARYFGRSTLVVPVSIYSLDLVRGLTTVLSEPDGNDTFVILSPDGRYTFTQLGVDTVIVDNESGSRQILPSNVSNLAWSPNSERLVFTSAPAGIDAHRMVFLAGPDGRHAHHVSTEYLDAPRWSPDSRSLLVTNNHQLYRIDTEKETLHLLGEALGVSNFEWSYDSSQIVYIANDVGFIVVNLVNADGTNPRTLDRGEWGAVRWSPVHNELLVWLSTRSTTEIYVADVSREPPQIQEIIRDDFPHGEDIVNVWWHPEGDRVFLLVDFQGFVVVDSVTGQVELDIEHGYYFGLSSNGEQLIFTPDSPSFDRLQNELCIVTISDPASQRCLWLRTTIVGLIEWLP